MHPNYVSHADEYKLRIPNLRRLYREGAHATAVRGVLPTVTYPSHTMILTGVWPVKHGIYNNVTFDPLEKNMGGWYWYADDTRVPTLWQAAAKAGYVTGSVSWPVSVAAPGVRHNIPEVWRAETSDDLKMLRAIATPGLVADLQKDNGPYILNLDNALPGDWARTRCASALLARKKVQFLTLHLAALDHLEHAAGPFSPAALQTLEEIDEMIGAVEESAKAAGLAAAICIVSDHGVARTDHELNLNVAFVKAGLMTPNPKKTWARTPGISEWKADPWMAGGSAAVTLKDPNDGETKRGGSTEAFRSLLYLEQVKGLGRLSIKAWTGPVGIEQYLLADTKGRLIQSLKSYLTSRSLTSTEVFGRRYTIEDLIA